MIFIGFQVTEALIQKGVTGKDLENIMGAPTPVSRISETLGDTSERIIPCGSRHQLVLVGQIGPRSGGLRCCSLSLRRALETPLSGDRRDGLDSSPCL